MRYSSLLGAMSFVVRRALGTRELNASSRRDNVGA